MSYLKMPTQEQRILNLLKQRGTQGVYAWEITGDLHILQYNARIFGLREKGHNIENKKPGHFVLVEKTTKPTWQAVKRQEKRAELESRMERFDFK